jgi:tetratricopeptide (TPR) repeat protein
MSPASADDPALASTPGRIGPYRIVGELGRGGIGTVFRAIDPAGRAVALKCLLRSGDPAGDARMLRESSIRVDHPNVVRTLGGGIAADGQPYLVLELLEGRTLREAFVDASAADVVSWVAQASAGVAALHEAGLIHRDIKPENLFLTRQGTVKVLDLGIAAWVDERARVTATGAVIGTPAYLAPEQVRGVRALDPRVDVWALGVVLFEGLTGHSPFRREGALATMLAVSIDPIPRVDALAPHVRPGLASVVHRCLERVPELRLASASELASALGDALHDEAGVAGARVAREPIERSLALLVAQGPPDSRAAVEALVAGAGGETLWLPDGRVVGVFGATESVGDEVQRVLRSAEGVSRIAGPAAVALGRGTVARTHAGGEAVREAGEALARAPGGVVCGPRTAQLLRGTHAIDEISPGLFRIGGEERRSGTHVPLLARDVELGLLRRARDAVLERGEPVVTYVVGAPGTGKTRLAEAVRGLAAEPEPPITLREAFARATGVLSASLFERALRGNEALPASQRAEDATVRVDQAREAIVAELTRLAEDGPLVLVLEDAQWADGQSLALVEDLPRRLAGRPVWLVVTGRPELLERLREPPDRASLIEPAPLGARDAIAMARALGLGALGPEVAQALVAHTGGNPLFIEVILGTHGAALETETLTTGALPATIEFAVQARIDRLPPTARAVLVALALLGRPAELGELEGLGCEDARAALELLVARDLVARGASGSDGGRTHRVRSPVVAQVALAGPSDGERRELHRRAAVMLSSRPHDDEELALHLESSGERDAAAAAYLAAALGAMRGGDARRVLRAGRAALRCGLPIEEAFELHLARADAARWAGEVEEQVVALEHAERATSGDLDRARVRSARGELARRRGDTDAALAALDEAIVLALRADDADVAAWARCRRAITYASRGRLEEAGRDLDAAGERVGALAPATRGALEDARGYVAGLSGDLGLRRAAFARAAELHAEAGDLRRAAGSESNAADAACLLGLFEVAESGLRRAVSSARRVGNRLTEGYALANLGRALASLQREREAREALGQARKIAASIGDAHLAAAVDLYACRLDPARADEARLAALLDDPAPTIRAAAEMIAAERASEPAVVAAHARRALEIAGGGLEEGEVDLYVSAAHALTRAGSDVEARAALEEARGRLEALAARITDLDVREAFLARGRRQIDG